MAILKKILGYEICLWEIEGNKYKGDKILLIRKNGFTEIINIENENIVHEMGDKISDKRVSQAITEWIKDNRSELLKECELAAKIDYIPRQF